MQQKKQTMFVAETLHDLTISTVTALNNQMNAPGLRTPIKRTQNLFLVAFIHSFIHSIIHSSRSPHFLPMGSPGKQPKKVRKTSWFASTFDSFCSNVKLE